jgi:thymidylate synthase (FAD)
MKLSRPIGFIREISHTLLRDVAFNRHSKNDGRHNSPFNNGRVDVGLDNIRVRLIQGINEEDFKRTLSRSLHATTGLDPDQETDDNWEEMMKGGLQAALESQVVVFEVAGVSRAVTHQLVRTRKAGFHQQSQRATFMGDQPDIRMPESIRRNSAAAAAFLSAVEASWEAYRIACEEDISYQDARYILPEGSQTYILCEYPLREFIATFAYRGCSMFLWETVHTFREMRRVLLDAHPWLKPYVRISCQTEECERCFGEGWIDYQDDIGWSTSKRRCPECFGFGMVGHNCTFQGWENVEGQCPFPWAKEELRTYKPDRSLRIGG